MSSPSPANTLVVRPAERRDMPAIVGIYNWAINQTFATIDSEPLSQEEAAEWWEAHARSALTLVAEDDGDVVGWVRLLPWRQRGFQVVEDLIYVDPIYQGRGIGRELLSRAVEAARKTDCRTILASVAADNAAGLHLHESLGFTVAGTIRNAAFKFGRWMDIALVQRDLSE